jgi:hypothetical protein
VSLEEDGRGSESGARYYAPSAIQATYIQKRRHPSSFQHCKNACSSFYRSPEKAWRIADAPSCDGIAVYQ